MKEPNYDLILKAKIEHYGETKAAYEFAAEEFARQKVKYCNLFGVSGSFSARDMQEFAVYVLALYNGGDKKKTDEYLKEWVGNDH